MSNFKCLSMIVLVSFSVSLYAEDSFKALVEEYLEQNFNIRSSKTGIEVSRADKSIYKSSLDLNLELAVNYLDNNLDSATAVNFAAGQTTEATFTLSKFFDFGSTLSLENSFSNTVQDPTRIAIFGGDPEVAEFKQTLSLSQSLTKNLLGKSFKLGLSQNTAAVEAAMSKFQIDAQQGVGGFSKAYVNLMKSRDFLLLQKAAYDRANKRKKLIDRRVRDGLSLKVDGYQGQIQLFNQKEQLEQAKQDFSKAKVAMSKLLHRSLTSDDKILKFGEGLSFLPDRLDISGENNSQVQLLKAQLKSAKFAKKLARVSKRPDVDFIVRYQTNDFNAESSEVFQNGNLAGDRNFLTLAVTATIPFDNIKGKENLRKAKLGHENLSYQLVQLKRNVQEEIKEIKEQLINVQTNVLTSNLSVKLAEKSLREYNKLYKLGKVSLDQVINAEQSLISNQTKHIGHLALNHFLKIDLLLLSGQLIDSIRGQK